MKAKVWGRCSRPYRVGIKLTNFSTSQEKTVMPIIAAAPALASELSLGKLPQAILKNLQEHNFNLLPESWDDIFSHCSCPDWANPCKHLAAGFILRKPPP